MGRHLGMSQVLPVLRLSKHLPTLGGIVRGLLTVQRTHGAVASNIFHYHLPVTSQLIPRLTSESLQFCFSWNLMIRFSGRQWYLDLPGNWNNFPLTRLSALTLLLVWRAASSVLPLSRLIGSYKLFSDFRDILLS